MPFFPGLPARNTACSTKTSPSDDEELRRFREEAAKLLGVAKTPPPEKEELTKSKHTE